MAEYLLQSELRARIPAIDRIAKALEPPWTANHLAVPVESAFGAALAAERQAQVYVLDMHTFKAAHSLGKSRKFERMIRLAQPPSNRMWLEWPTDKPNVRSAMFIERDREQVDAMLFAQILSAKGMPIVPDLHLFGRVGGDVGFEMDADWGFLTDEQFKAVGCTTRAARMEYAGVKAGMMLAFWIFLATGAAVVSTCETKSGREYRKRGKVANPSCILSYNTVVLRRPAGEIERSPVRFNPGPGVRYHHVSGHWKYLDTPLAQFIEEYWRGDKELGVVAKRRFVKAAA